LIGCSSSVDTDLSRVGQDYFPIEVGLYRIYDMQDTMYLLAGPDIRHYQLRERVIDSVIISSSETSYTLERSVRDDEFQRWQVDSIWTARINPFRAVSTENNLSFVKLTFPIENNMEWDGNVLNSRPIENYKFNNSLLDTILFDQTYNQLWTVTQSEKRQDFLGKDIRYEIYSRDIGLLIKSVSTWVFCQSDCSSLDQIVAGRGLSQTLIEYGKE